MTQIEQLRILESERLARTLREVENLARMQREQEAVARMTGAHETIAAILQVPDEARRILEGIAAVEESLRGNRPL